MTADTFVRETQTSLQRMREALVELEGAGDEETVDELFRTAHNLKGTFGMEGHERASDLAHAMEGVLEAVRAGELQPDGAVVDECLDATDTLGTLLEEVDRYGGTRTDPAEQVESLGRIVDDDGDSERDTTDRTTGDPGAGADTAAESALDAEVEQALEAASEFDDLDALADEMEEPDDIEMGGGGSFDDIFEETPGGTATARERPSETGGAESVEQALEAASEFDDLDTLTDEMEEPEGTGTLDGGGSFEDIFEDAGATGTQGISGSREETDTGGVASEGAGAAGGPGADQFGRIRSQVDREQSLSSLQAEIEAEDFGEFDDEDDMTIQELVSMDPESEDGSAGSTVDAPDEREALREVFDALAGESSTGTSSATGQTAPQGGQQTGVEVETELDTVGADRGMEAFESRFESSGGDTQTRTGGASAAATLEGSSLAADRFRPDRETRRSAVEAPDTVQSLTVDIEYADDLLSLVEELSVDLQRLKQQVDDETLRVAESLDEGVRELQQTVMKVRLMPVETVTSRLDRVARDAARSTDRQVELTVEGAGTRVDRSVIDRLGEPLVHLVRNAVDHGIEPPAEREAAGKPPTGTVAVSVRRTGEQIVVEVSDDGRGIDPDAVRAAAVDAGVVSRTEAVQTPDEEVYDLVFEPGVSTTETVTDTSGRGVGMDVVREAVEAMNGRLTVESTPDEGTTVALRLPVTLAVSEMVVVEVHGQEFAVPAVDVERVSSGTGGRVTGRTRADADRRVDLGRVLGVGPVERDTPMVVVVETVAGTLGIECERVVDRRTAVVTPYDDLLAGIPELSGATTGTDEQLVHVLDVSNL